MQYFLTKNEWSVSKDDWEKINLKEEVSQLVQYNILEYSSNAQSLFSQVGWYSLGTGDFNSFGNYYTTDYIPIDCLENVSIIFEHPVGTSANKVTIFDSNKEYVGYSVDKTYKYNILLIAPTAAYVRFSCFNSLLSSIKKESSDGTKFINIFDYRYDIRELFGIVGFFSKGTGDFNSFGNYYTTDYIPLEYLKEAYPEYIHSTHAIANKVTLFDTNKNYIGYSMDATDRNSLLLIAPTAVYAKFSCFNNYIQDITVVYIKNKNKKVVPLSADIFMRVGCIGDSYTAGFIRIDDQIHSNNTFPQYSWPRQMKHLTGREWTNFGKGGSSTKSWIEGTSGLTRLSEVQAEGNKCQAYVIGLGINDINGTGLDSPLPVGTVSDIGTDADSYYAYYYKLVTAVYTVNNKAKIFLCTLPQPNISANIESYNQAVRDIVSYCYSNGKSVYLLDLAGTFYVDDLYANEIFSADFINGHYTAIGYSFMAQCMNEVLSIVINENISDFQDVFLIDYDEPLTD